MDPLRAQFTGGAYLLRAALDITAIGRYRGPIEADETSAGELGRLAGGGYGIILAAGQPQHQQ